VCIAAVPSLSSNFKIGFLNIFKNSINQNLIKLIIKGKNGSEQVW
jgi:hypothetical protein